MDSAVEILFEHAGPVFHEQVIKWGAVHADQRRCAGACLHMPENRISHTESWTALCIAALTRARSCILPTQQMEDIRRQCLRESRHLTQLTGLYQSLA